MRKGGIMNTKIYDFGVDSQASQNSDAAKVIAWPIEAWCCFVPDNITTDLNIIEKLILSLIDSRIVSSESDVREILCNKIGLDAELVKNVFKSCQDDKGYISKRDSVLKLNQSGKNLLDVANNGISLDMEFSEEKQKVYMFKDLVTNTIVPFFGCKEIPSLNDYEPMNDENVISLKASGKTETPRTAAITNAVLQWGRIRTRMKSGDDDGHNTLSYESKPLIDVEDAIADGFDFDTEFENSKAQKANHNYIQNSNIEFLTIYDDKPQRFNAKAYITFNCNNPDEVKVLSPFDAALNEWFAKILDRARKIDSNLDEEIKKYISEQRKDFQDKIAFDNPGDIQLFNKFPPLCNDVEKYGDLKTAIIGLTKDLKRFEQGEDETDNFKINMRVAIEVLFRTVVKRNPEVFENRSRYARFNDYNSDLNSYVIVNSLSDDLVRVYQNDAVFRNMKSCREISNGHTKDYIAMMMLYAFKNPNSKIDTFIKDYSNIITDAYNLTNMGNRRAHGIYDGKSLSFNEAKKLYAQYEAMVKSLYEELIKEEK